MSIYTTPLCSCIECRREFSSKGIQTHYIRNHTTLSTRTCRKNTQVLSSCLICKKTIPSCNLNRHYEKHFLTLPEKICPNCDSTHNKPGTYCSYRCSNSRIRTSETKKKISRSLSGRKRKKYKPAYSKISFCKICQTVIRYKHRSACSEECRSKLFSLQGRTSAAKTVRRSKDEIKLFELCDRHFENVSHNEPIFNGWDADILIYDTKQAILWNGPWHYQEMPLNNHSLKQVQNRDHIKQKEIIEAGWEPIIFEDRDYTPQQAFALLLKKK